jgi:solute carrier family 25 phosphate transporter 23/24/25/41
VIKTRLAAAPNGTYTGITDVVRKIVTKEGPMAFFRGLTPSLLSTAPHSGIDLTVYEVLKRGACRVCRVCACVACARVRVCACAVYVGAVKLLLNSGSRTTTEYTKRNEGKSPGVITLLGCASASSVAGLLACYPLHVAKTRMIMQSMHGAPQIYSGVWNVFTQTYSKEGFVGLYRGLVPSILKSVPSHCITFVTYEFLKKQFGVEKHSKH